MKPFKNNSENVSISLSDSAMNIENGEEIQVYGDLLIKQDHKSLEALQAFIKHLENIQVELIKVLPKKN